MADSKQDILNLSLNEIKEVLTTMGLYLGMDVPEAAETASA